MPLSPGGPGRIPPVLAHHMLQTDTAVLFERTGNRAQHAARPPADRGVASAEPTGAMRSRAAQGLPAEAPLGVAGAVI
ncbi:hypothetical protein H0H10_37165 [Streptomyces sp. TRM S81-3]|uniref:Uncharacterized protein n=1 Tax=Streptomyces griseicoloratus TaxID=2752516 RepID=A0A926QV19_9ACTN|nr:hypothetical protein [Streptomyces griseicoloratus]MBD0424736.1 hypothetical protein [Streptomyces griseicoloratus]